MQDYKNVMIPRTSASWQRIIRKESGLFRNSDDIVATDQPPYTQLPWQQQLQDVITNPIELLQILNIDSEDHLKSAINASQLFSLKAPRSYVERIEKGNINDPLLLQLLPVDAEFEPVAGYSADPVGEQDNKADGMIQKYHGRALLIVNGHCAINCRYCFRREFPYADNRLNREQWQQTLADIAQDISISEVIYSGGDPLASSDKQLTWLTEQIANIPHIQRLRIHTRLPVVIPNRITAECLKWMSNHRLKTIVVLHINHANELNDSVLLDNVCAMKKAGIEVLNQTVLLRGVNDSVIALRHLSERLFHAGIIPYYLHLLDKVNGSAHFDVPVGKAKELHQELTAQLSGYLVPKLVQEIAGHPSKVGV